jgi:pyrroline-5-carboxylate reductase
MKTTSIGFIGGGRITGILLQAFKKTTAIESVYVFDVNANVLSDLKNRFPKINVTKSMDEVLNVEVLFLAVHPPVVVDVLTSIRGKLKETCLLVSLAPKISLSKMSDVLGGFSNLVRMNPSASSIVAKGVNPVCFDADVQSTSKEQFLSLVQPIGYTPLVEESKIEAYAVISAMGHTYFFFQLQKLKELAVSFGMEEVEAQKTISNMLWGTTETLFQSGLTYPEVADLIPVKPMTDVEEVIKGYYDQYLTGIFQKIKP